MFLFLEKWPTYVTKKKKPKSLSFQVDCIPHFGSLDI